MRCRQCGHGKAVHAGLHPAHPCFKCNCDRFRRPRRGILRLWRRS